MQQLYTKARTYDKKPLESLLRRLRLRSMETWKPKSIEDNSLYQYWSNSKGHLFLEVPVGNRKFGNWTPKSKIRRIDGF